MWLIPVLMGVGYLLGSIPSGFLIVRVFSGQDVRQMGSGRTGGTNVMRAAGFWPGLLTALLDMLKATASVWIAKAVLPLDIQPLGMALAGLCAILGHNYSLFLKFKGGAGGAPCVGGAIGIWPWSGLIIVPLGAGVLFGIGYASVATLSAAVFATALFAYRFYARAPGAEAEFFVVYGLGSVILLAWALRPNIQRLIRGEERVVGWRARRLKQANVAESSSSGES